MSSLIPYGLFLLGLALLYFGGDLLVVGASAVARRNRISPMVIGLTIVGFGTSLPELLVSSLASFQGRPEFALGNVIGSNICNILLVLGVAALIRPIALAPRSLKLDVPWAILATLVMAGVCYNSTVAEIDRIEGGLLLVVFVAFLIFSFRQAKVAPDENAGEIPESEDSGGRAWIKVLAGLLLLPAGAYVLVNGALDIADAWGVSDRVIALTMVALGTSLPELAVTIAAAARHQAQLSFGNIIGSCVFNALCILGVAAVIAPIGVGADVRELDLPLVIGVTGLLVFFSALGKIGRIGGGVFLLGYVAYVGWLFW